MAIRDIVPDSDELIRKKSREVTAFDQRLWGLLDDMKETMKKAEGCGLAGVQVGILRRLAIVEFEDEFYELINPTIVARSVETEIKVEGCLSVKGKNCYVKRPLAIAVEYQDRFGKKHNEKFSGYIARICSHEIDHLDGILYYDRRVEPPKKEGSEGENYE